MARETKVGLLVGIGFIVCFAVILSNRSGFRDLHSSLPYAASAAGTVHAPAQTATLPEQRVRDYVHRTVRAPRAASLEGETGRSSRPGQGGSEGGEPLHRTRESAASPLDDEPGLRPIGVADDAGTPIAGPNRVLARQPAPAARATVDDEPGEDYDNGTLTPPLKPIVAGGATRSATSALRAEAAPSPAGRTYVVQPGDTLSKIAKQFYGHCGPKTLQAIQAANPERLANPDVVQTGQTLILPGLAESAPAVAPRSLEARTDSNASPDVKPTRPDAPSDRALPKRGPSPRRWRWYQVQKGDLYGTIALKELGSSKRWKEIFELNKDVFPDPSRIRWGVRIKIPMNGDSHPEEGAST
jgi:nucleoid-associated protein YgaU